MIMLRSPCPFQVEQAYTLLLVSFLMNHSTICPLTICIVLFHSSILPKNNHTKNYTILSAVLQLSYSSAAVCSHYAGCITVTHIVG